MRKIIAFKRKSDGELFTINDDSCTYTSQQMKVDFPKHLHNRYTMTRLRALGAFEPIYAEIKMNKAEALQKIKELQQFIVEPGNVFC